MFLKLTLCNYLTMLLALVSVSGDYLGSHSNIHVFQAVFDNATHAIVGGISWLIFCINFKNRSHFQSIFEIGACTFISSFIDIDHFLSAKSFNLKDATNLARRPPLHCSTYPFALAAVLLCISYMFRLSTVKKITLLMFTAFLSHHTRDATRRGYWFHPFGNTVPIPYGIYIILVCLIPHFVCYLNQHMSTEAEFNGTFVI